MAITLLKIKVLPKRIHDKRWVEIEYSCAECGGLGTVRVTDREWRDMMDHAIPGCLCAECGGWGRTGSEKIEQGKVGNSRAHDRAASLPLYKKGSDAPPPRRYPW